MNKGLRKELSILSTMAAAGFLLKKRSGAATLLGVAALALRLWPTAYSIRGRSVVITGGSRGLGMAIAEQFLKQGANVTLLGARQSGVGPGAVDAPGTYRANTFHRPLRHDRASRG